MAVGNVRDRVALTAVQPTVGATDMAQLANTWLLRARLHMGRIKVDRSVDAGVTWTTATVSSDTIPASIPTLARDQRDNVYVWWHVADGLRRAFSEDYGRTWDVQSTATDLRYPRMALNTRGRAFLVGWDPSAEELGLYAGEPLGTLSLLQEWAAPEQLASLEIDARDWIHIVYGPEIGEAGAILHRMSEDDGASLFSVVTLVAEGAYPSYAVPEDLQEYALLAYRDGTSLLTARTDETYGASATVTPFDPPAGTYQGGYVGTLIDHRAQAWLSHNLAGQQAPRWTRRSVWVEPS